MYGKSILDYGSFRSRGKYNWINIFQKGKREEFIDGIWGWGLRQVFGDDLG